MCQPDPETIMMRLWEEENRPFCGINYGLTPIDAILCETQRLPGHLEIPKISARDRQVVAATVQWLATNCGRSLYERFQKKLKEAQAAYMKKRLSRLTR